MKTPREKETKQRLQQLVRDRARRITLLINRGMIRDRSQIPDDAIPADPECSTKTRGWSPEFFYRDIRFVCRDCGDSECWSAVSQQYYYEVIQASPYKEPVRCFACRQREVDRKDEARRVAGHDTSKTKPPANRRPIHAEREANDRKAKRA